MVQGAMTPLSLLEIGNTKKEKRGYNKTINKRIEKELHVAVLGIGKVSTRDKEGNSREIEGEDQRWDKKLRRQLGGRGINGVEKTVPPC